jgi:hypothetical protein
LVKQNSGVRSCRMGTATFDVRLIPAIEEKR